MSYYQENKPLYIAVDFDGTMVSNEYPFIGDDIGAFEVLRKLIKRGHHIILNTARPYELREAAIQVIKEQGIELFGINENPTQSSWTDSKKVHAQVYIDDMALGIPLVFPILGRPHVDWEEVEKMLKERNIL